MAFQLHSNTTVIFRYAFCLAGLVLFGACFADDRCDNLLTPNQRDVLDIAATNSSLFDHVIVMRNVSDVPRTVVLVGDEQIKKSSEVTSKGDMIREFPYVLGAPFYHQVSGSMARTLRQPSRITGGIHFDRRHEGYPGVVQLDIADPRSAPATLTEKFGSVALDYFLPVSIAVWIVSYFEGMNSLHSISSDVAIGSIFVWYLFNPKRGLLSTTRGRYDQAVYDAVEADLANQPHVSKALVFVDHSRLKGIVKKFSNNGWRLIREN